MKIRKRASSPLHKKAKRGFRGYPVGTVAFYGPTADRASKVVAGIGLAEGEDPAFLERWFSDDSDVRQDLGIMREVLGFLEQHAVKSVVITDGLLGCPHEEGIDYPQGQSCPQCPYWAGRDRFTGERLQ